MKYNVAVNQCQPAPSKKRGLAEMQKPVEQPKPEPEKVVEAPAEPPKRRFNPFASNGNAALDEELKAQEVELEAQREQQRAEDEAAAQAVQELEAAEQIEESNVEMQADSKEKPQKQAAIDPLNAEWETLNRRNE